jgi:hypothetical protein
MSRFMKLFDPVSPPAPRRFTLAPRPPSPRGLRLGLVDNTRFNAHRLLSKLAGRLARRHGMGVTVTQRKRSPSHAIEEAAVGALRARCDLVVSGIGD